MHGCCQRALQLPDLLKDADRSGPACAFASASELGNRQRGIARGELSQDVDRELALDLMAAPLFWRATVTQGDTSGTYVRTTGAALLRAIDGRGVDPRRHGE
jgi:hypothetical protein